MNLPNHLDIHTITRRRYQQFQIRRVRRQHINITNKLIRQQRRTNFIRPNFRRQRTRRRNIKPFTFTIFARQRQTIETRFTRILSQTRLTRRQTSRLPRINRHTFRQHHRRIAQTRRRQSFRIHTLRNMQISRQPCWAISNTRIRRNRNPRFKVHQTFTTTYDHRSPRTLLRIKSAGRTRAFILPRT